MYVEERRVRHLSCLANEEEKRITDDEIRDAINGEARG
jgi:hypothetical protein